MSKVVIFGNSHWASLAAFFLKNDSPHEVAAFTVDGKYLTGDTFEGLPQVAFEDVQKRYSPDDYEMFLPISFKRMNHLRAEKYAQARGQGYDLISYVSTKATVWPGFRCGDNCFILEGNNIQPYVEVGSNVVMWSGNHIGHHSKIMDHVMITSHVVISGSCVIGPYSFLGVNATIRDETVISRESLVGAGAIILKDTEEFNVYKSKSTEAAGIRSDELRAISHKTG